MNFMVNPEIEALIPGKKQNTFHFDSGEVLNIDKPPGITSFRIVRMIRQWSKTRKVGHAGTLDPMATGVLLVCTGKATRDVSSLMGLEKGYEGTLELGITTDTDDAEGIVLSRQPLPEISRVEIDQCLSRFKGEILQVPPQFSAIKKNGVSLYKTARKGIYTPLEPRRVAVYEIRVISWESPLLKIFVRCGKGTYIRALARDIGSYLNTGGILTALRRVYVGPYHADNAWDMNHLKSILSGYEDIQVH
jgi:tRNA pseudouridine55 synthase